MLNKPDRHKSRGTYASWRLAPHCVHTIDIVCQFTRHLLELQPINIVTTVGRGNISNLLSKEDGVRVALKIPGRREVKDGDEGTIVIHEIVLADR